MHFSRVVIELLRKNEVDKLTKLFLNFWKNKKNTENNGQVFNGNYFTVDNNRWSNCHHQFVLYDQAI